MQSVFESDVPGSQAQTPGRPALMKPVEGNTAGQASI